MTKAPIEQEIFKKGSTTYYFSSRFFPRSVRTDVFRLYSFVRVADDYVDNTPTQPQKLLELEKAYARAMADPNFESITHEWDDIDTRVIKHIVQLTHKYKFDQAWVEAFFASMKSDIKTRPYKTLDESLTYVYGSAEVIGLMMSKIMGLPDEALPFAKMQGRAMQWINFIRDIAEDNELGRCYFPVKELKKYGLKDLKEKTAIAHAAEFRAFIEFQVARYQTWQTEADKGMEFIPLRLRVPLKTAISMYNWTAEEIAKDPFVVFERKLRPSKRQVLQAAATHGAKLAKPDLDFLKKS